MIRKLLAAEAAFDPYLEPYRVRADHIMVRMNWFLMAVCLGLAPWNGTFQAALAIGLPTVVMAIWLQWQYPGQLATRLFMASGFMVFTGLIIHQSAGDIEGHFAAFGLIGVLLYYRDWRTIVLATVVIYMHHLVLGYAQTLGSPIFVFDNDRFWTTFFVHVAYFLPFVGMMSYLSVWLRREGYEDQHVITLARQIIQGNLIEDAKPLGDEEDMPLIGAVRMMKSRLLDLIRIMPVATAVIRVDTDAIVSVNEAWIRTIGPLDPRAHKVGQAPIWAEPHAWAGLMDQLRRAKEKLLDKVEVVLRKADGTPILCELSLILHIDVVPTMAILTVEDISLRRKAEETMSRLAFRDMLTDLPNRASLHAALDAAHNTWHTTHAPYAVIMMDLDGFKPVNDTYGHDAGDEVLKVIGVRLASARRSFDVVARLGGDEFAVVVNGCTRVELAEQVGQRLIDAVSQPISLRGRHTSIWVGASAGVALVLDGECSAEAVLTRADRALYEAKAAGKHCVRVAE